MRKISSSVLIILLFLCVCCHQEIFKSNELRCLNTIFLWEIIGSDSTYYEFYFDDKIILYYEEGVGGVYPCVKDSSVYYGFISDFFSSSNILEQGNAVGRIFTKVCRPNVIIKSIRPIGSFLYHYSNASYDNYILFGNEASERCLRYKGYKEENEIPDSVFDVITIPEK